MRYSKLLAACTVVAALSLVIFTAACHKNRTIAEDTGYAADQALSEQTFNDVQAISDQASGTTGNMSYRTTATTSGPCARVTHLGDSIIIDFGPSNCMCRDGRNRRGQIIVTYTGGGYANAGSVHTITFNNFYQNDNKITGFKRVTNMGNNSFGQPYFNIHIEGSVTHDGGGTVSTVWDRVRTQTEGAATTDISDDVYHITGSGTLTRANGTLVNINIATPLVVAESCRWIEAGTVTFSIGNKTRSLNYGDTPVCDDNAVLTIANGNTRNVVLP